MGVTNLYVEYQDVKSDENVKTPGQLGVCSPWGSTDSGWKPYTKLRKQVKRVSIHQAFEKVDESRRNGTVDE